MDLSISSFESRAQNSVLQRAPEAACRLPPLRRRGHIGNWGHIGDHGVAARTIRPKDESAFGIHIHASAIRWRIQRIPNNGTITPGRAIQSLPTVRVITA